MSELPIGKGDDVSLKSSFFEQLVEHTFVSELLQEAYYGSGELIEVLRSEIDASGYDVVLECRGIMRHVQLKTSRPGARAASQKVHRKLAEKPGAAGLGPPTRGSRNPEDAVELSLLWR